MTFKCRITSAVHSTSMLTPARKGILFIPQKQIGSTVGTLT